MDMTAELAIRQARASFNRALADADLAAIGRVLAPAVMLVTGTDSAVIAGRKAQLLVWKREFGDRDRTVYTRTPASIVVSPVEPIAFEHGDWTGTAAADGAERARGAYTAKWRRFGNAWLIEAELYLTLA